MRLGPKNQAFLDRLRALDYTVRIDRHQQKAKSYREDVFGGPATWSGPICTMIVWDENGVEAFRSREFGDENDMLKTVRKEGWIPGVR